MWHVEKSQFSESSSSNSVAEQIQKVEAKNRIKNNSEDLKFFRRAFGATLILTFGVVYLQGLGIFHLSNGIIYSLCTATVGELAGLFTLSIRQK
jgi:hypothetical protein